VRKLRSQFGHGGAQRFRTHGAGLLPTADRGEVRSTLPTARTHEREVVLAPMQRCAEGRRIACDHQAVVTVTDHFAGDADVGRDDECAACERFEQRQRAAFGRRCDAQHVEASVEVRHRRGLDVAAGDLQFEAACARRHEHVVEALARIGAIAGPADAQRPVWFGC